jgi:nicotinate-nucleotide adenylyltransferase
MTIRLPRWTPGQRIGLMGGSFNPAHEGHLLASRLALRRLKLDRLWWLVTPGNPLKPIDGLQPLAARILAARAIARDPRIALTGFEAEIGAHYTYDSIVWLLRRAPTVRFVWIMGADNLLQFHLWRRWREMAQLLPIAVVDRPGSTLRALNSQAAGALAPFRVPEREAAGFATKRPPAIIFLHGPRSSLSSSAIRRVSGRNHSDSEAD